jgi:hypothetical protein
LLEVKSPEAMKRPEGRPTKYNEEILQKTKDYFSNCLKSNSIPFIEELSLVLDISRETIYAWCKEEDKKMFSDTVKKIITSQKLALLKGSLDKDKFTPGYIFQLKINHDMVETERKEISGPGGQPLLGGVSITSYAVPSNDSNKENS